MNKIALASYCGTCAALLVSSVASAATAKRDVFGTMPDGTSVEAVTLAGHNGVSARIIALGATLQAFNVPGHIGTAWSTACQYRDKCATFERRHG